jgi:hypothetical protein
MVVMPLDPEMSDRVIRAVDDVIRAVRIRREMPDQPFPADLLAGQYTPAQVYTVMRELEQAHIIEYGISLRTGWVRDYDPDIEVRINAFKADQPYPVPAA